jgi:hypothetical protein
VTTPTPRVTRGGSFTAPILTQLLSLHKHYKHRVQAKHKQGAQWLRTEQVPVFPDRPFVISSGVLRACVPLPWAGGWSRPLPWSCPPPPVPVADVPQCPSYPAARERIIFFAKPGRLFAQRFVRVGTEEQKSKQVSDGVSRGAKKERGRCVPRHQRKQLSQVL